MNVSKLVFIGAGNMAEALTKGLIAGAVCPAEQIVVTDVNEERLAYMRSTYQVTAMQDNAQAVQDADVVVLAVKPQMFPDVLPGIAGLDALVISIAAGLPSSGIAALLGAKARVIRVMPNTPALVQCGAAGISPGPGATEADAAFTLRMFEAVGYAVQVDESLQDVVTSLSGSGPAYFFYIAEAMLAEAEASGMDRDVARMLVAQTLMGAGQMVATSGIEPDELRRRVTSKGGTTAAALAVLEAGKVGETVRAAVSAARERSRELSGK
ncbi:MAG: pyrroline-5-carboxylate reductase [Kiritimatiellia bacterium]|jgi:pyrroline-5-carboxylate reductase